MAGGYINDNTITPRNFGVVYQHGAHSNDLKNSYYAPTQNSRSLDNDAVYKPPRRNQTLSQLQRDKTGHATVATNAKINAATPINKTYFPN
jgi:hypothetical protein